MGARKKLAGWQGDRASPPAPHCCRRQPRSLLDFRAASVGVEGARLLSLPRQEAAVT